MLPFVVMGSCLLLVGVLIFFLLPANVGQMPEQSDSSSHKKRKYKLTPDFNFLPIFLQEIVFQFALRCCGLHKCNDCELYV